MCNNFISFIFEKTIEVHISDNPEKNKELSDLVYNGQEIVAMAWFRQNMSQGKEKTFMHALVLFHCQMKGGILTLIKRLDTVLHLAIAVILTQLSHLICNNQAFKFPNQRP